MKKADIDMESGPLIEANCPSSQDMGKEGYAVKS